MLRLFIFPLNHCTLTQRLQQIRQPLPIAIMLIEVFEGSAIVLFSFRKGGEAISVISGKFGISDDEVRGSTTFDEVVGDVGGLFFFMTFGVTAEDVGGATVQEGAPGC